MSQRVKKPGRSADDSQGKRRRRRPSGSDADEDGTRSGSNSGGNGSLTGMWTPRHLNDLKVSSIYNRNSAEAPAELYRKDLISAMKLPDSEPLTPEEYWLITDSWKQEWEKGVQVPVNPESLPEPEVKLIQPVADRSHDFRLPKKKYVRVTHDDFFNPDYHQLVSTAARAEKVCSYDLDDVDAAWLGCSNADRAMQNTTLISEFLMEQVIEELELQCWEQVQTILKSQEGLGIEYDENVICDVCRSPESEEGNEMVFCDSCNICVHQACYGITTIPSGSWLCRTCRMKPACVLCPNVGGAMKATRSGHTWAHVACAIWIPEVSIGSVEKMEPITKISSIPQSRWSLICVLCKEKTGACIQCSVKTCKTAYHVTCAFKNGLEMKPIIVDENAEDGIKLRSYCQKHSVNTKNKEKPQSGSEDDAEKKKLKAMTAEERNQARAEKLQQIEAEFYKYVRLKDVSQNLAVDMDIVILIYNYWKLKRKSLNNRPLVPPRPETTQLLTQQQEQDLEQMKMFVQLRQDLERVRNLCYMVSRREKLSRSFFRLREQTFQKQLALLTEADELTPEEREAILSANHGPSIYDQFYSHHSSSSTSTTATTSASTSTGHKSNIPDYETLMSLIAGVDAKKDLVNGLIKNNKRNKQLTGVGLSATSSADAGNSAPSNSTNNTNSNNNTIVNSVLNSTSDKSGANPYKKQFVNGARRRNLLGSGSSHSESESEKTEKPNTGDTPTAVGAKATKKKVSPPAAVNSAKGAPAKGNRKPLSYLFDSDSSADNAAADDISAGKPVTGKKATGKVGKGKIKGKALAAMAGKSSKGSKNASYLSDSDELELPVGRGSSKTGAATGTVKDNVPIYSDSEESGVDLTNSAKKETKASKASAAPKEKGSKALPKAKSATQGNQLVAPEPASAAKGKLKKAGKEKAASVTPSATAPKPNKTKTKAGGKKGKKDGFDPTELIVPQREAAKKATESIRSVKQKAKDQQQVADNAEQVGGSISSSKEDKTKDVKSKANVVEDKQRLSDSDDEDKIVKQVKKKGKSPEEPKSAPRKASRKGAGGGTPVVSAQEDETGELDKDEFEFDMDKDGSSSKNVSYVPQRQAAKKAAEHIRSGLSNIVAARLIIEDEMELARKKTKTEKGQQVATKDDSESHTGTESTIAETAKKLPPKGPAKTGKAGKKEPSSQPSEEHQSPLPKAAAAAASKKARGNRDTADWPFLDKGSQSACRRSRERSSSSSSGSSGSSSSGSSCSSRSSSASSSRSSSVESASPEPRSPVVTKKASNQPQIISPITSKLPNSSKDTGPGRKLKTSERRPNNRARLRAETSPREKPAPKGGRPSKSGPGRGDPFRSAFSPSPEPEARPASPEPKPKREQLEKRIHERAQRNKVSPLPKTNEQQRAHKSKSKSPTTYPSGQAPLSKTKGGRGKRESSSGKVSETQKDSESGTTGEKRSPTKTLERTLGRSPVRHTGPCLSSESETEAPTDSSKPDVSTKARDNSSSRSHQPTDAISPTVRKKKSESLERNLGLSDSDDSGAEEKENSCVPSCPPDQYQRDADPPPMSPSKATKASSQKNTTAVSHAASILSPLTPTENKEKEPCHASISRDSEQPESKRPRLDSMAISQSSSSAQLKSIFSPPGSTGGGRDGEILDFDSELYDLARSVVTDEYHGDEINSSSSLSFSFSQEIFSREDNKEDSARATLNLVEKLRLQHARKSGVHRPSTESSSDVPCDSLLEEIPRSPSHPGSDEPVEVKSTEKLQDKSPESSTPSSLHPVVSPDRTKQSIQGDERWVPPSSVETSFSAANAQSPMPSPAPPTPLYANIPDQSPSPPAENSPRMPQSQIHHAEGEGEKPPLRSPVSYHEMISHVRPPHGSHSSISSATEGSSEKGTSLSVDTPTSSPAVPSPIISPVVPGLNQGISPYPSGPAAAAAAAAALAATLAAAETSPNLAATVAGLPFGANPFIHPALANNPAFASVVNSLSLAPFLQVPIPKTSPAVLAPVSPVHFPSGSSSAPFPPFIPPPVMQAQPGQQGTVRTPAPSPTSTGPVKQQRRPSDVVSIMDGKILNSPLVSVSAGMPHLAKPPLTSPSVLLQLSGVKTVTPPIMSNMAHIIESVVNNHRSDAAILPKTTLSLDLHMPSTTAAFVALTSTNTAVKTPLASPLVTTINKHVSDSISAVLATKTTENIIAGRDTGGSGTSNESTCAGSATIVNVASSPKQVPQGGAGGRGRRASAQRAVVPPIKTEKLSGVNAVIEDMMMSPQPKGKGRKSASQSPGRGKGPARRGRGKGKGKNVVGVRKDLAGTVYDIDFDEFEENAEEKIDLRALRERRKSSEVHSSSKEPGEGKHSKRDSSGDRAHSGPILLTLSVPHSEKNSRHKSHVEKEGKEHRRERKEAAQPQPQQPQLTVPPISIKMDSSTKTLSSSTLPPSGSGKGGDKGIHSILQAPLPGPVDMRTYSASESTGESLIGKIGFPLTAKDHSSEIASLFMNSSVSGGAGTSTTVNDLEELDKALEVLASTPKHALGGVAVKEPSPQTIPPPVPMERLIQTTVVEETPVKNVIANDTSNRSQGSTIQNNTQLICELGSAKYSTGVSLDLAGSKHMETLKREENLGVSVVSHGGSVPPSSIATINSDMSRDQLKVKIKGPFLDANYSSANSMQPGAVHGAAHQLHGVGTGLMSGQPQISVGSGTSYSQSTHSGSYGGPETGPFPAHHQHHPHQQWMMGSMMGSNPSNLRRMRKKELLRQYWTQDMNMDGGSNLGLAPGGGNPGSMSDMSALPSNQGVHPHHPISRSVITIPKAVASMSIMPTKEDYRLEEESNDSNPGSMIGDMCLGGFGTGAGSTSSKGSNGGGRGEGTQKKRRSRGIYREMAALGILPPDVAPKERRRERTGTGASNSGGNTPDSNGRKRPRNNNKPSRSTFIPPTLVESADATSEKSSFESSNSTGASSNPTAALVNLVNHPTPKLKIKFGDQSNPGIGALNSQISTATISSSSNQNNVNHLSDSDKETPNKKAKGRPPKKRGLPDAASSTSSSLSTSSSATFSMEELKRESMKYREMIMKEFDRKEEQEILKLSGTRRRKKHKRKAGASAAGSETDDGSVRSKSPEVKVITDGVKPKLILRIGKSRSGSAAAGSSDSPSGGTKGITTTSGSVESGGARGGGSVHKVNENGLPSNKDENSNQGPTLINADGSSECSAGTGGNGNSSGGADVLRTNPQNGSKESSNNNNNGSNGDKVVVLELGGKASEKLASISSISAHQQLSPQCGKGKNTPSESSLSSSSSTSAAVPIRLKLSRCYEGYSLKNKEGRDVGIADRENGGASNAAKQSDSCQVR